MADLDYDKLNPDDEDDDDQQPASAVAPSSDPQPSDASAGPLQQTVQSNKQIANQHAQALTPLVTGDMNQPPSDANYRAASDAIQSLQRNPLTRDTADWEAKMDEAKKLYQSNANRNAWLSLAQTIGQGLIRIAAANEGMKNHVDMSHVDLGPGYDVEAANKRNLDEYKIDLNSIDEQHRRAIEDYRQRLEDSGISFNDSLKKAEARLGMEKDLYNQQMTGYEKTLADRMSQNRLNQQENRQDERLKASDERQQNRFDQQQTMAGQKASLADLASREKELNIQKQAADQLAAGYQNYDTLDKKGKEKFNEQAQQLAGKAGIADKLPGMEEAARKGTGYFGLFQSAKPEVMSQQLNKASSDIKAQLDALRQKRVDLLGGKQSNDDSAAPSQASTPAAAPQAPDRIVVQGPDGKQYSLPKSQLQQAISQGYKQVGQ